MKRLRFKIDNLNLTKHEKEIRYYIASEYGPTTLRPHYHGVLFFDSEKLLAQIENLISYSWGIFQRRKRAVNVFGFEPFADMLLTRSYIKLCDSNTAFYVAEYVSGNLDLPNPLRCRNTKPFHLQSKNPVIGCYKSTKEEVLQAIYRGDYTQTKSVFNKQLGSTEVLDVPLSTDVLSSLFRKCFGFSDLSFHDKLSTYNFFKKHLEEWNEYIKEQIIIYNYENDFKNSINSFKAYLNLHPSDRYRDWCARHYSSEYSRLCMDKDETWYSSKKAYHVTEEINFNRYYPYLDSMESYVRFFDKYIFLKWSYQQTKFYELFNKLVNLVGFQTTMLHAYPFICDDLETIDRRYLYKYNGLPNLNANQRVFIEEVNTFAGYYMMGLLRTEKLERSKIENTLYFHQYVLIQKQRFKDRTKTKKINNTKIYGVRRID